MNVVVIEDNRSLRATLVARLKGLGEEAVGFPSIEAAAGYPDDRKLELVFLDDMLPSETSPGTPRQAVESLTWLAEHHPDAQVVIYSTDFGTQKRIEDLESLKPLGVVDKELLLKDLPKWLELARQSGSAARDHVKLTHDSSLEAKACLEEIGEGSLKDAIQELVGHGEYNWSVISGGMSGDKVLQVVRRAAGGDPEFGFVLKFTRLRAALEREVLGGQFTEQDRGDVGIQRWTQRDSLGWYAGKIEHVDGPTLEARLLSAPSGRPVRALAASVYERLLHRRFCAGVAFGETVSPAMNRPSFRFILELADSLSRLESIGADIGISATSRRSISDFREAVVTEPSNAWPFKEADCRYSWQHGDFHVRNVLFDFNGPVLIDWSRAAYAPRVLDACAIMVDAVLRAKIATARRPSAASARRVVDFLRSLPGESLAALLKRAPATPGAAFAVQILSELRRDRGRADEVAAGLTFQLLRYSRMSFLPLSDRLCAALAAVELQQER